MQKAKKIALSGLFIAITVILARILAVDLFVAGIYAVRLSLEELPIILSGILFGPFFGAAVGAVSDIVGYLVKPMGGYFPGFTLSAALTGFLPAIYYKLTKNNYSFINLFIIIAITNIICSLVLNTIWISILSGKAYILLLPARVLKSAFLIPVNTVLLKLILNNKNRLFNISTNK